MVTRARVVHRCLVHVGMTRPDAVIHRRTRDEQGARMIAIGVPLVNAAPADPTSREASA